MNMFRSLTTLFFLLLSLPGLSADQPTIRLVELDGTGSLQQIEPLIRRHPNIMPDETLVGFDCDGTLTQVTEGAQGNPQEGKQQAGKPKQEIRGGQESRDFIDSLDARGLKWFVFSARASSSLTMQSLGGTLLNINLQSPEWSYPKGKSCYGSTPDRFGATPIRPILRTFNFEEQPYNTIQCDNCISVVMEGGDPNYAFDKDIALEYASHLYFSPNGPNLIVFVDDNAKNVMRIYNHFLELAKLGRPIPWVYCVLYPPTKPEDDHAVFYEEMKRNGIEKLSLAS